jgi:benzil reductase ((S)-benzoin forming)
MKTAIITGASSGIGKSVAEQLLKESWKVYGLSRSKPAIDNENLVWVECDLANAASIKNAAKAVAEPTVDFFLSNAGVAFEEPASEVTENSYNKMFSVNVLAPMLLVNAFKEKITQAVVVSISSVSDRITEKDFALYCASKAAITRYFEAVAQDLAQAKVYSLLLDYVDTPMLHELQDGRDFDWSATLKVEDVAKLSVELVAGKHGLPSGSNVIVINNALKDDMKPVEKLYGFNADTGEMIKLPA